MKEIVEEKEETIEVFRSSKICSDFDDDCKEVKNHFMCWLGNECIDRADGLCPMIHSNN